MSVIYEPRGKAREYSPLALNLYMGCTHKCKYCYGPSCLQRKRENYFIKPEPRANVLKNLERELSQNRPIHQVLMSFIGDPYGDTSDDNATTRKSLELLLKHKVPVAVLTKGGKKCLKDIDLFKQFGEHIQIGATLTFDNDVDSLEWESGAALPQDRLNTLKTLHENGIKTFASFEPVIDPAQSISLMKQGLDFIDVYKIGKINNYGGIDKTIDWTDFLQKALDILRPAGKQIYIKHDLRIAASSIRLYGNEMLPDEHNAA